MANWIIRCAAGAGVALGIAVLPACSGDKAGTDDEFVQELCDATKTLDQQFAAAVAQSSQETDPAKAVEALATPLDEFVKAFDDANPPEDLEDWHDAATKQLRTAVDKFKEEKTLASLEGFGDSPVPDPPAEAKARLRDAGKDVEGCDGVAFLKP
jgi:hypothetical protein